MPEAMSPMYKEYAVTPSAEQRQCAPVDPGDDCKALHLCSLA